MNQDLEIAFCSSGSASEDSARLEAILRESPAHWSFTLVIEKQETEELITRRMLGTAHQWRAITGAPTTEGINRALLLGESDVILSLPGASPVPGALRALIDSRHIHDRICAAVPTHGEDALECCAECVPAITEIPAPDVGLILLSRLALNIVGGLDPSFQHLLEALADWTMRAQRMGLVSVRALQAAVRTSRNVTANFPLSGKLIQRHPAYEWQVSRAETDPSSALPAHLATMRRGGLSVCIDARYLPEDAINGTGVYAIELCRALRQYTPARVSWFVATEGQRRALSHMDAPVFIEGQAIPEVQVVHRPAQVFKARDLSWLLRTSAPLVITYQDLIAYRASSVFPNGLEHETYRLVSDLALRSCQAVIAISHHSRSEIIREFCLPEEAVAVVHHGVRAEWFSERESKTNRSLLAPHGITGTFFLSVGADYAHKNLRSMLAAFSQFRIRWPGPGSPPELVIVGHPSGTSGGVFPQFRASAPAGITFLADVSDSLLRALYQESLGLLYLSAYEGFGLPILEAMAAGTPVLCSRLTSIPEVAGDAALFADKLHDGAIASLLLRLATQPELRQALAQRGFARAREFAWAQTARRTYALYERAVASPTPHSLHHRRVANIIAERLFGG